MQLLKMRQKEADEHEQFWKKMSENKSLIREE